jgi:hypothetical protein
MEKNMTEQTPFPDAEQERVRAMVRSVDVLAPPALRAAVEEQIRVAAGRRRRRWPHLSLRVAIPSVALPGAAVVALVLVLSGGGAAAAPSLAQTAQLTLNRPTAPAVTAGADVYPVSTAGIEFPSWRSAGWRPVGRRADTIAGRTIDTVYYTGARGTRVGYAIVPGTPLAVSGGRTFIHDGTRYVALRHGSALVVTWQRDGHTCVIAGHVSNANTLLRLASIGE